MNEALLPAASHYYDAAKARLQLQLETARHLNTKASLLLGGVGMFLGAMAKEGAASGLVFWALPALASAVCAAAVFFSKSLDTAMPLKDVRDEFVGTGVDEGQALLGMADTIDDSCNANVPILAVKNLWVNASTAFFLAAIGIFVGAKLWG